MPPAHQPFLLAARGNNALPTSVHASKAVNINIETDPNPAAMGDIELVWNITDSAGTPMEGATVDIEATHLDMAGMDRSGAATEQGAGKYATNAKFSMSGNWKLKVDVRKDGLDYVEEIDLPVQ